MAKTDLTENQQVLPMTKPDSNSSLGGETVKQWLTRHNYRSEVGFPTHHHHRIARFLTRVGFVVKTIQRSGDCAAWIISLRPGTVDNWRDSLTVRRLISKALRELHHKCPAREIGAYINGQVLQVSFGWDMGKPGIATFWSANRVRPVPEH